MRKSKPSTAFAPATGARDPETLVPLPEAAPPPSGALALSDPPPAALPAAIAAEAVSPVPCLDAHGFDPQAYDWVPVQRRPRKDGWSPAKQRRFIEILADTGCVAQAAQEVGMAERNCYALRRAPGAEGFAAAWDAAIQQASAALIDLAFDRVIHGTDEPIFDREGRRIGRRMRQDNRLLMFLLRAYRPDRFRHAHESIRRPGEQQPAPALPVPEALARLAPVPPADPHRLKSAEEIEDAIRVAEMREGRLPPWYAHEEADYAPDTDVPDARFEAALEEAKAETAREAGWVPPEDWEAEEYDN